MLFPVGVNNQMSNGSRPDLDPVLRRAFMAPAIAEWTRVLGRSLIVSTTEDDDTAAANCAVEVVMAVDGAVRGKVTYTLPAQTVRSIAASAEDGSGQAERDPIPAIQSFFKPIATRAREMLQASGLGCTVSVASTKDVRGASYSNPVTSPHTVHMVTQPSAKDTTSPEPVSLWFDLEMIMAASAGPQGLQTAAATPRAESHPAAYDDSSSDARRGPTPQPPQRSVPGRLPGAAAPGAAGGRASAGGDNAPGDRAPGYSPVVRTGRLEILDESGTARAVVSTLPDGSPHIVFADRDGRIRAAISLTKDGQPRILFLDEMGRRILDLPHAGSSSQLAGQQPPRQAAAGANQPMQGPAPQQSPGPRPHTPPQPPTQRRPDNPPQRRP